MDIRTSSELNFLRDGKSATGHILFLIPMRSTAQSSQSIPCYLLPSTFQHFLPKRDPLYPISLIEAILRSSFVIDEKKVLMKAFRPTSSRQNLVLRFTTSGIVDCIRFTMFILVFL